MSWVVWRLHRSQVAFALAALGAAAVVLAVTGVHFADTYDRATAACGGGGCQGALSGLFAGDVWLFDLVAVATLLVPALLGLFWGAPLLAKEVEDGTHKLAWTQTVTRRRWAATTVAWVVLAAALWGAAMSALVTWWSGPVNALSRDRFTPFHFDTQGLVPAAYAVFAVCLGIAAGALARRLLPALALTVGGFLGLRVLVDVVVRRHYLSPVVRSFPLGGGKGPGNGDWLLSSQLLTGAGRPVGLDAGPAPTGCQGYVHVDPKGLAGCLASHGWHWLVTFQPAGRWWAFQGIEAGIYLALAALLLALAAWRILAADA